MFTSFSPIISPKRLAAATHSVRPEMPKYSTARSSNGLGPRSEADVVLDLAILTKKSSAVRIQRTSAGLVERRTIRDATKPLSFVTHFHFAANPVRLPLTGHVFGGPIPDFDTRSGSCRCLDHPSARFCQTSAELHCRCSSRPEDRAAPSKELSDSRQTFEGAVRAGRAHR